MQDNRFNPSSTPTPEVVPAVFSNTRVDESTLRSSGAQTYSEATPIPSVESSDETTDDEGRHDSDREGAEGTEPKESIPASTEKSLEFLGVTHIRGNVTFTKEQKEGVWVNKLLGKGSFGEVYKGQWGNRNVALKKIDIGHAKKYLGNTLNEQDILDSLEWEISRLSTVNHPNCVQFYGIYRHPIEKQIYLVMEFCDRGNLGKVLESDPPAWSTRWQWALEISQGLAYLHQEGILHRDLKAENILIDQHGCAKLADLGVAQVDALLADKDIEAVKQGLQDLHFISPEKSLANYNRAMVQGTPEGQHTRLRWLSAQEKCPSLAEMDGRVIYLKETSPTRICASWWIGSEEKSTFTVDKKKREKILHCFAGKTVIEQSDERELFDQVTELCGYQLIPLSDTPAMDMYALGFVFWQMVSGGKKPRSHDDDRAHYYLPQKEWSDWMLLRSAPDYEREPIPTDCPSEWRQLILDCWQYDPEKRPTAQMLVRRIQGILSTQHEQSSILQTCEKLDELIHSKRLEALSYVAPYLTADRVDEPIETYWKRFEGTPIQTTTTTTNTSTTTTTTTTTMTTTTVVEAAKFLSQGNPPLDLQKTLHDFLEQSGSGALLLLGDAGLGKTLTTYRLADAQVQAWRDYLNTPQESRGEAPYVPIFIRPTLKHWSHSALTDAFTKAKQHYGLDKTSIPLRFLVIVDGYDECQLDVLPQNLCAQLGLIQETSVKILVTCRPNTVERLQLSDRFALHGQLEVRYFLPFNFDQVLTYLNDRLGWGEATRNDYIKKLNEADKLRTVLRNPFVLQLFVQSWETLAQKEFKQLNRSDIYEGFIQHWIHTQQGLLSDEVQKRLRGEVKDLAQSFELFAAEVAFTAFQNKGITLETQVVHQLSSRWGEMESEVKAESHARFKEREAHLTQSAKRRALLTEADFEQIMLSRLHQFQGGLPLKEKTLGYEFSHKSFFEYFVAQRILNLATLDQALAVKVGLGLLNSRPIQEEPEVLDFLVESWADEKNKILTPVFFGMILASRQNPQISQASANAVTILNACRVSFTGKDLSHTYLPGADLSYAMLHQTCLHGANLRNVSLSKAYLRETDLTKADLTGARFGEFPSLKLKDKINCVAFSKDGKWLAIGVGKTIEVWKGDGPAKVATLEGHVEEVTSVSFDPTGACIVSGSQDNTLRLWEVDSGKPLAALEGHTKWVTSVSFDPTGACIVSGSEDNTLRLWEAKSGKPLATLEGHTDGVSSVSFSPTGARIVSGSRDGTLRLWEAESGKPLATLKGHTNRVTSVSFDPTGARIVSGSDDNTLRLWEAESGETLGTLEGHTQTVASVSFDPTGSRIVSGSDDNTLRLWEAESGKLLTTLEGHTSFVTSVSFDPRGSRIVSGSWDKTLRFWEAESGKPLATLEGHTSYVTSVSFDSRGSRIVSGSWDKTLRLWEADSGKPLATLEGHTRGVSSVSFDPTGSRIVSGSGDNTLRLWEADSGKLLATLEGHTSYVNSVSFNPRGSRIVSGSNDHIVRLWEADSGKPLATLEGHTREVSSVSFDPTGSRIASGSVDHTLRLWEAASGKLLATLKGHTSFVTSVSFDPRGSRIVSGSGDNTLRLWEANSGRPLATLEGHTSVVTSVSFDPRGSRIVSGSADNTLRLWEAASGKPLAVLEEHAYAVTSVSFDSTGARIVSGSSDKSILLWQSVQTDETKWQILHRYTTSWPLFVSGAFLQSATLSPQDKVLLLQRGAKDKTPYPSYLLERSASEQSAQYFQSFWSHSEGPAQLTTHYLDERDQQSMTYVNKTCNGFFTARRQQAAAAQLNPNTVETPKLTG